MKKLLPEVIHIIYREHDDATESAVSLLRFRFLALYIPLPDFVRVALSLVSCFESNTSFSLLPKDESPILTDHQEWLLLNHPSLGLYCVQAEEAEADGEGEVGVFFEDFFFAVYKGY